MPTWLPSHFGANLTWFFVFRYRELLVIVTAPCAESAQIVETVDGAERAWARSDPYGWVGVVLTQH